jgi:hypothetical protein
MKVHREKSTNKSKGKPEQKFDAAYGKIFRIREVISRKQAKTLY